MKASICIATFKKPRILDMVLNSIVSQTPSFEYEIIVVNDENQDEETKAICSKHPKVRKFIQIPREPTYRNPSAARNVAYREARGDVLICQSDDVVHTSPDAVERLVNELLPKTFSIATVYNTDEVGNGIPEDGYLLTGESCPRPFFFLGSLLRSDLYAAGGNDERYVSPGYDDDAFGNALVHGLNLAPNYVDVVANHIDHPRPSNLRALVNPSKTLYQRLLRRQKLGKESWLSPGAPWLL